MKKHIALIISAVMLLSSCAAGGVDVNDVTENAERAVIADNSVPAEEDLLSTDNKPDSTETGAIPMAYVPSKPTEVKAETGGIKADFSIVNKWMQGNLHYTQISCTVKNNTSSAIKSWTVSHDFPNGTKISDSWNGNFKFEGNKLTVTNVSYNGDIPKGGSTEFGFIVSSPVEIKDIGTGDADADSNPDSDGNKPDPADPIIPARKTDRQTKDWLVTDGNKIYTESGQEVWLTGINWFGYNTGTNTFDGLWTANADALLAAIADRGFNLLRIPFSTELIHNWQNGKYPEANYNRALNAHWNDMNSLEIFDYIVDTCDALGIKIMIDIHSAKTDPMGHMKPMWYDGDITEKIFIDTLVWMAERYAENDTIIAYDLQNEPHGKPNENPRAIWNGSKDKDNWKYVAEKAALAIMEVNPNVLIVVEGIEIYPKDIKNNADYSSKNDDDYHFNWWGGNLRGVKDFPIDLGEHQNKLVYSPHDYGPTVHRQPWFYDGYNYDTLYKDVWRDNWMFIYEDETAPLLIGEWGGFMSEPNLTWMTHMRTLISTYRLHHTFWCLNANSGDTGGLVEHDFATWDEEKYEFLKPVLWQHEGKFVGLSHEVPLGRNGISLNEFMER